MSALRIRGVPQFAQVAAPIFDALSAGQRVPEVPEPLVPMLGEAQQPFLISVLPLDSPAQAARLTVPVLAVQGDRDFQTTPQDAANLAGAGGHVRTVILHGMNHVLKDVGDDMSRNQQSYLDASIPLHPELARTVADFIRSLRTP